MESLEWEPREAAPGSRRSARVTLETSTHAIHGTVTLPAEGYRSRFSDLLNRQDLTYLSLSEVERVPLSGGPGSRHSYLAVARNSVLFGYPADQAPELGREDQ
jgi:hypothetical protein